MQFYSCNHGTSIVVNLNPDWQRKSYPYINLLMLALCFHKVDENYSTLHSVNMCTPWLGAAPFSQNDGKATWHVYVQKPMYFVY